MISFDIIKLIKVTIETLKDLKISTLDGISINRKDDCVWNKIWRAYSSGNEYSRKFNFDQSNRLYFWWSRDTNSFKSKILSELSKIETNSTCFETNFDITNETWNNLKKFIYGTKRQKFSTKFDFFLNQRLKEQNINCWLVCKSNCFSTDSNNIRKSAYWTGTYDCYNFPSCQVRYNAKIQNKPNSDESVTINVKWNSNFEHENIAKEKRCAGVDRRHLALELKALGNSKVKDDNFVFNRENRKNIFLIFCFIT